jgi:succinate dehydrogenase hydrophobic anchor subunit
MITLYLVTSVSIVLLVSVYLGIYNTYIPQFLQQFTSITLYLFSFLTFVSSKKIFLHFDVGCNKFLYDYTQDTFLRQLLLNMKI